MHDHADLIAWAAQELGNDRLQTAVVAETPYSTVIGIEDGQAAYYLKRTPPGLFIEVDVVSLYRDLCGITAIPQIVQRPKA